MKVGTSRFVSLVALGVFLVAPAFAGGWKLADGREVPSHAKFTPPRPINVAKPVYPAALEAEKVSGKVAVECTVAVDGSLTKVEVVSSTREEFAAAASEAAKHSSFEPASLDGQKVAAIAKLHFTFEP